MTIVVTDTLIVLLRLLNLYQCISDEPCAASIRAWLCARRATEITNQM